MTATPNAIDVLVGRNIRYWRLERELTVLHMATALGMSATALGSIEVGATRIGAEDLWKVCVLLQIDPAAIYEHRGLFPAG